MPAEPLIDLRPLKIPAFAVGVVANMLSLVTIFAMNIIVPTFMQSVLGTPPLVASLTLFPAILCSCAASPLAGRAYDKHGPGMLLPVGFGCIAVFSVLTALFIATASPVVLAIVYIPVICGSALVIGPVQSFALSKLPPQMNPHGVTVMSTGFQIAGCFGSSVFTGVYALVGATAAASGTPAADAAAAGMVASGVLVGVFALVGFGLALWIRRIAKAPVTVAAGAPDKTGRQHEGAQDASLAAADSDADAAAAADSQPSGAPSEGAVAPASALAAIMKTDVFTVSPRTTVVEAMELSPATPSPATTRRRKARPPSQFTKSRQGPRGKSLPAWHLQRLVRREEPPLPGSANESVAIAPQGGVGTRRGGKPSFRHFGSAFGESAGGRLQAPSPPSPPRGSAFCDTVR